MLKQRIITALILAPLALYAILFLPIFWFEIAIAGVVGIGAYEWANMSGVCERPKKLSEGLAKAGMNRVVGDHMGMLATVMNGLAMRDALHRAFVNARMMSAIPLNGVCDAYNWAEAISLLKSGRVVIFSAGTGNPFFTTDSAACLRGIEIEADAVLKATKVDGVYSDDPVKNPEATLYEELTYQEVLEKELKVMDLSAFTLARDHSLPIRVFNMNKPGCLKRVVMGEKEGTVIRHADND